MYRYKAMKRKGKKIDEHRLIMEQCLNRKLRSEEIVHHKNGDGKDNSILNLQIMSRSEHVKLHFPDFGREPTNVKRLRAIKNSHVTRDIASCAMQMLQAGCSITEVAKILSISRRTIARIKNGAHWFSTCPIFEKEKL